MLRLIITLRIGIFTFPIFAQDSTTFKIKDFSLRDYEAPDIKYRQLDAGMNGSLNGGESYGNSNGNLFFRLFQYQNLVDKQTVSNSQIAFSGSENWAASYTSKQVQFFANLDHENQNRYYGQDDNFLAFHFNVRDEFFKIKREFQDTLNENYTGEENRLYFQGYLTAGKGRIQPVAPARRAMDILISLEKYNRLTKEPSSEMVDSLAKVANRVIYKRFFDRRYKRIYQLEELDKAIQSMQLVDNPDMIYAANLSDVWNFALNFNRGAGTRIEYGLIPTAIVNFSKYEFENLDQTDNSSNLNYGLSGMFAWTKASPISYKWQSDLRWDINAGYSKSIDLRDGDVNGEGVVANTNFSWNLGYYPNTRTYLGFRPFVNFDVNMMQENSSDEYNGQVGASLKSYYYVSQRFRVSLDASYEVGTDYYFSSINKPFWNEVNPIDRYDSRRPYGYSVRIRFDYAII